MGHAGAVVLWARGSEGQGVGARAEDCSHWRGDWGQVPQGRAFWRVRGKEGCARYYGCITGLPKTSCFAPGSGLRNWDSAAGPRVQKAAPGPEANDGVCPGCCGQARSAPHSSSERPVPKTTRTWGHAGLPSGKLGQSHFPHLVALPSPPAPNRSICRTKRISNSVCPV